MRIMTWKGFGKRRPWPNFKVLTGNSLGGTGKNHENLHQDILYPGRDLNPEPPEYEAGPLDNELTALHHHKRNITAKLLSFVLLIMPWIQISARWLFILTQCFVFFPHFIQSNCGKLP
jgi:hypothetical protein